MSRNGADQDGWIALPGLLAQMQHRPGQEDSPTGACGVECTIHGRFDDLELGAVNLLLLRRSRVPG